MNEVETIERVQDAIKRLREIQTWTDTEIAHNSADQVLTDLLLELGYRDVVMEWELVDKWYA